MCLEGGAGGIEDKEDVYLYRTWQFFIFRFLSYLMDVFIFCSKRGLGFTEVGVMLENRNEITCRTLTMQHSGRRCCSLLLLPRVVNWSIIW